MTIRAKTITAFLLFLLYAATACGCASTAGNTGGKAASKTENTQITDDIPPQLDGLRGIWLSCYDLTFAGLTKDGFEKKISTLFQSVANAGYNAVFCHVRPFADAYYKSDYFPYSRFLTGTEGVNPGYDPLTYMLKCAKACKLQFHAWINPYRVSTSTTNPAKLSAANIAAKWLTDGSNRAAVFGNGIYFSPASPDVQRLVLNGIRELLDKYAINGIHFDDYFYPTTDPAFDSSWYAAYCKTAGGAALSLGDWRRAQVNSLISAAYRLCKLHKNIVFGISPAGDISVDRTDRNYTEQYADVPLWMREAGYADYIVPQLYFGYNHPAQDYRYDRLLKCWTTLPRHSGLRLYIGLAAYKIGDTKTKDTAEWCDPAGTLLARQATDAVKAGAKGFVVFSYEAAFSQAPLNRTYMQHLYAAMK